jgi:hypothetical protein
LHEIATFGDGCRVGKHVRRLLYLPPGAKPRYRFVIALGTIVLLAFSAMVTVAALYPENGPASAQPTGPVNPFPNDAPLPGLGGQSSGGGDPAGALIADYTVPPSWVWATGFQAQIAMTNTSPAPQNWQVRLTYPESVTAFTGSWVDGAPQPASQINGQEFTFTGNQPVPPGQTVLLRVQFDRAAGDFTVGQCQVNGRDCTTS